LLVSVRIPGAGYLFTWPLLFAAGAEVLPPRLRILGRWVSAAVTALMLVGFTYGVSVVMLGVTGGGAIALAVVASLVTLLLIPLLEVVAGDARWSGAPWLAAAGLVCLAIVALTVHPNRDHPLRSALVYAENADSSDAWLGAFGGSTDQWTRDVIGESIPDSIPPWTRRLSENASRLVGRRVQRVPLGGPMAALVKDSVSGGIRHVVLRVSAPAGTTGLVMRASAAKVSASAIDGRVVDTTRYRHRTHDWLMQYWAVPDSGALVALSVPAGGQIDFELAARRLGIPPVPGVRIPPRPANVVPSQSGDVSIAYRQWRF
ncbi:MAG TPA: hypothetical protein VF105_07680, partial [Gemmatimonadaceae bacterium]